MELISRTEAAGQGLKRYFTGKPCVRGHIAARQVANTSCSECLRIHADQYKRDHPEIARKHCKAYYYSRTPEEKQARLARQRRNYANNPLPFKRAAAKWEAKHPQHKNLRSAVSYQRNREQHLKRGNQWYRDHPEVSAAKNAKRRAAKVNATPAWITDEQLREIAAFYAEAKRLTRETKVRHAVDHVVPLKSSIVCGLHVPWNYK